MLKDFIISILMIYIFSGIPGWSVSGFPKLVICAILVILETGLIYELEMLVKEYRK